MGQIRHADDDGPPHSLLHAFRRIAQPLAETADLDLRDAHPVSVKIGTDPENILRSLFPGHAQPAQNVEDTLFVPVFLLLLRCRLLHLDSAHLRQEHLFQVPDGPLVLHLLIDVCDHGAYFDQVDRFADEEVDPRLICPRYHRFRRDLGDHDKFGCAARRLQFLHDLDAVLLRHQKIHQDHVGIQCHDLVCADPDPVGNPADLSEIVILNDISQDLGYGVIVLNNEELCVLFIHCFRLPFRSVPSDSVLSDSVPSRSAQSGCPHFSPQWRIPGSAP